MRAIEIEEENKAKAEGREMIKIHMAFKRNVSDDARRYNIPKIGEIAVVFTGEDGMPPTRQLNGKIKLPRLCAARIIMVMLRF